MLELADIEPYLSDRGLISARAVVDGGLRVVDHSSLNRVFLVTAEGERSLVVKVADEPGGGGVSREAAVLERLWSSDGEQRVSRFLPPVVSYDRSDGVLVLGTAPGARDLSRHHARGRFSRRLASLVGTALASLHDLGPAVTFAVPGRPDLSRTLSIHQPTLESFRGMSTGAVELTAIIQRSDELCTALDDLQALWRSEATVHGDLRWDNCLAVPGGDSRHWTGLQLIDWEHAADGDPAIDIASFLGEYLRAWLQSIPIADAHEPGQLLAYSSRPLRVMRPAVGAFWEAYSSHRRCRAAELTDTLQRAVRYAGAVLLIAALDEAQTHADVPASALLLVPLSTNVLARPAEAAGQLLGLHPPGRAV